IVVCSAGAAAMKNARSHNEYRTVKLYPATQIFPSCQQPLQEYYRKTRWVVTLTGLLRIVAHVLHCQTPACPRREESYKAQGEGALVLPHYTFGLDVIARIGGLRYSEHQTVNKIASELQHWRLSISV